MKRGEIYWANLDPVIGSEQGGVRPVVVVQNDKGNLYSPTVIVAAVTTSGKKNRLPIHVPVSAAESGLKHDSMILTEQLRTLEKTRLTHQAGQLTPDAVRRLDQALMISQGLSPRMAQSDDAPEH